MVNGLHDRDLLALLELLRATSTELKQSLVETGDRIMESKLQEMLQALGMVRRDRHEEQRFGRLGRGVVPSQSGYTQSGDRYCCGLCVLTHLLFVLQHRAVVWRAHQAAARKVASSRHRARPVSDGHERRPRLRHTRAERGRRRIHAVWRAGQSRQDAVSILPTYR